MNKSAFSFNALPPIDIPFRFFVCAPFFAIGIALLILYSGESIWISRWHPVMLSITHGFTLGCISSVMMGALFQVLPVVGAGSVPYVRKVGICCHIFHILGSVSLIVGFIYPIKAIQLLSILFLLLSFSIYIAAISWVLVRKFNKNMTIHSIRLSILSLIFTVILGVLLQLRVMGVEIIPFEKIFTNLHALWGLFGWVGLLIVGVSFQIVPMFHVAPSFPFWLAMYLPLSFFFLLVLITFNLVDKNLSYSIGLTIIVGYCFFSLALLNVINQRKRKLPDTTVSYWQLSAISIFAITLLNLVPQSFLFEVITQKLLLLSAAIFIYFYALSVIQGMLLKILPFLSYTHLQQLCLTHFEAMPLIPHMHEFLKKTHGKLLFIMHFITGAALLWTIVYPSIYWLFGGLLLIEFSWLLYLMFRTFSLYKKRLVLINELILKKNS